MACMYIAGRASEKGCSYPDNTGRSSTTATRGHTNSRGSMSGSQWPFITVFISSSVLAWSGAPLAGAAAVRKNWNITAPAVTEMRTKAS